MKFGRPLALAVAAGVLVPGAAAAQVPMWVKLVHWISGDSNATTVPIMTMGGHMQMSRKVPARPGDAQRAGAIVAAARGVLARYPDVAAAARDGYRPFHQTGAIGEEVHYTSIGYGAAEGRKIDYAHPGSILFVRTRDGLKPAGVMYGAPNQASAADLDARVPLSAATWHRHVDFCYPTKPAASSGANDPRFGFDGSIHDKAACEQAGGYFLPLAFGWMTHVYPGRADPWGGEHMDPGHAMHTD